MSCFGSKIIDGCFCAGDFCACLTPVEESFCSGCPDCIDDGDEWECEFPGECLSPSILHSRDECYTLEMAKDWATT